MTAPRRWATKTEVAEHIHASIRTVDRMVERGDITAYPIAERLVRFDLDEIDQMIAHRAEVARNG